MTLDILINPNPGLRTIAEKLTDDQIKSPRIQEFIDNLIQTMKEKDGIGLAAPQVGKPWRIFCVATANGDQVFINPKIIKKSWFKQAEEEGCLSIPEVFGLVKRAKKLMVKAQDRHGQTFTLQAAGLFARVIQHESDHLQGVLFIDKTIKITKGQEKLADHKNSKSWTIKR